MKIGQFSANDCSFTSKEVLPNLGGIRVIIGGINAAKILYPKHGGWDMHLTDMACRNAKAKNKPYKISDGDGLFLFVHTNGGKYWRLKYRFMGKEKTLAIGVYPDITLIGARERRSAARKQLLEGIDPAFKKQQDKLLKLFNYENNFESVARIWHKQFKHKWSEGHAQHIIRRFEADVFPIIGKRPVAEITAPEILKCARLIEKRGAHEVAHRAVQACGQVFRYAIANGLAVNNPVPNLRGALVPVKKQHYARLSANELPEFFEKLETYDGILQTKLALKLLVLTFVRTSELRGAEWGEFDLENAEWHIPAERMKMKEKHIVPLSTQATKVIKQLIELNSHKKWVFSNQVKPQKFMSENTMLYALYRLGYHSRATGHGFRSTASTILNEQGFRADVIERQLAHGDRDKIRASYNHAQYLPERRIMMQWWADYLDDQHNHPAMNCENK